MIVAIHLPARYYSNQSMVFILEAMPAKTNSKPKYILKTMEPDFDNLNKKFPNRNWREIYRRMMNGEEIASSLRMAIEREKTKDK